MQSVKGKKTNIPAKPTEEQQRLLNRYMWMEKDWFGWIFKSRCREVESRYIYGYNTGKGKTRKWNSEHAEIYACDAVRSQGTENEQKTIYCFFVYYNYKIWKADSVENVADIIKAIIANHDWDQHVYKLEDAKDRRKAKLKKLRAAKKAA